jgi:hypothetical protein
MQFLWVQGSVNMHDTLSSLVERALKGSQRPLEFYLRENGRLPGARANMELANDVSYLLAASVSRHPDAVHFLTNYFTNGDSQTVVSNTPAEFVMICGLVASGACAALQRDWQAETFELLGRYAYSPHWRVRRGVATAYQHLLASVPDVTGEHLMYLASEGNYWQQCAAITTIAEEPLLYMPDILATALQLQHIILERLHNAPIDARKGEDFRTLKRTLGFTLSVITVSAPEQGFALMRECATWNDNDIRWILRENLNKKRLAKFVEDTRVVSNLLA